MVTIQDIRRANLEKVLANKWGGKGARLAKALEVSQTVLSRIKSTTDTRRDMGNELARRIEEVSALPSGWMDERHDIDEATELAERIRALDPVERQMVELIVSLAARRSGH